LISELAAGAEAVSPWFEVSQRRIDEFADTTEDRQSIHIDPELAASRSRAAFRRIAVTVERDGGGKPVCIAELLLRCLR
jgi:acyl dehydratase